MRSKLALVSFLMLQAISAFAQSIETKNYPERPVRLIVPWPAGGGTDIFARAIGEKLHQSLGQPFLVENRAGASGNIGASAVAKSAPDGYTIMIGTITLATNPALYKSLDFDATKDLATITLIAGVPHMLVVHPTVPANNVKELIALARQKPGKLSYSSAGVGSPFQIAAELFKQSAGVDIFHVPYKGGAPAIADVIGHHVDMTFANLVAVLPQAKAGQIRALAVTSTKRSIAAPDVPTMAEAGLPSYEFTSWFGVLAPAKTPHAIVQKLNTEITKVLHSPEISARLSAEGAELIASTPEAFGQFLNNETAKWSKIIRAAGIQQIE
ncbi:MAG TPA: tripartite tricarboxylate transporter substrate binding protein [Xanthobacteraceae bacterium]|nr:tripartite tricarboxylate transporter substrate binding protein [Xanthobacteraceae bacterium]